MKVWRKGEIIYEMPHIYMYKFSDKGWKLLSVEGIITRRMLHGSQWTTLTDFWNQQDDTQRRIFTGPVPTQVPETYYVAMYRLHREGKDSVDLWYDSVHGVYA